MSAARMESGTMPSAVEKAEPPRIMIVEDEPLIALDLSSILQEMGCTICAVAETAEEAVEAARRERPDLILADIRLQGEEDGISAIQRILDDRRVPVLFVSGNWPELRKRGMGDALVIGKPFLPAILKQAIRTALDEAN
jgi:CheY-like chemotaxis protein